MKKEIAIRFQKLRKEMGLSQRALALELGVSKDQIGNIESERTGLSIELMKTLVQKLHLDSHWMLTGEGNMFLGDTDCKKTLPAPLSPTRAELRSNDRKAQLQGFIDYYFEEYGEDEQAWLLIELKKQLPEFKDFLAKKDTDSSMQRHAV